MMKTKEQAPQPMQSLRAEDNTILHKTKRKRIKQAPQPAARPRRTKSATTLEYTTANCNPNTDKGFEVFKKDAEQLKARAKRIKGCGVGHIVVKHNRKQKPDVHPIKCQTYSCPHCAEKKRKIVMSKASLFVSQFPESVMMTLTLTTRIFSNDKFSRSCESVRYINAAWKRFRALLWKRKIRPKFFRVIEFTKAGTAHIHCIISHSVDKHIVKACWRIATEMSSWQICVGIKNKSGKTIRGGAAASYIAKYIAKMDTETADILYCTGSRVYSNSPGCLLGQRSKVGFHIVIDVCHCRLDAELSRLKYILNTSHESILCVIEDEPPPF